MSNSKMLEIEEGLAVNGLVLLVCCIESVRFKVIHSPDQLIRLWEELE